ncbi:hypothetical protein HAX54_010743 [Datura stramonium]|uniref:Uncharacterized protein n=1 Tax=Datura stramonium TaxID=4076 RepID=A0ABS8TIQ8_DATST|nr:hypothetical protein [Datura stramonium]
MTTDSQTMRWSTRTCRGLAFPKSFSLVNSCGIFPVSDSKRDPNAKHIQLPHIGISLQETLDYSNEDVLGVLFEIVEEVWPIEMIMQIQPPQLCKVAYGIRNGSREVTSSEVQMIQVPQANFPTTSGDTKYLSQFKGFSQHLPSLLMSFTKIEPFLGPNGLCWHHNHDHHLIFPTNVLYLSMFTTLANCVPYWDHNLGNLHYHNSAFPVFFDWGNIGHSGLGSSCPWVVLACFLQFMHLWWWRDSVRNVTLAYESAMALCYITGAIFYVSRVPEKWRPGLFDLVGHSHQIFHTFVIFGALAHYGAARIFLDYRTRFGCDNR